MSASTRRLWSAVQALLLVATLTWVARALFRQWDEVRAVAEANQLRWGWIVLASAIVLTTYAMLIESWRLLIAGWGGHVRYGAAVRIWTIANLGRYVPGKLWSVGALALLARKEGVSGVTAAGAAILGTLLNGDLNRDSPPTIAQVDRRVVRLVGIQIHQIPTEERVQQSADYALDAAIGVREACA